MSLRTRPRDFVLLQPMAATVGSMGQEKFAPDGPRFRVACNVYPLDASESESLGLVNSESRSLHLHRGRWLGDQHSEVIFEGSVYEQRGPAVWYGKGSRTKHWRVILRRLRAATPEEQVVDV